MSDDKYSVILTAFSGNWEKLNEAVPDIFGRKGLDMHTVVHPDGLPSELVANVTCPEAERIACKLRERKADVEIMPTSEVKDVEHRADDLWYSCAGEHFSFTEVQGIIVIASPIEARRHAGHLSNPCIKYSRCGCEDDLNHMHIAPFATGMSPREAVREGNAMAERLEHDLSGCFPDRRFLIYLDPGERITFCQATDDAPKAGKTPVDSNPAKAWCTTCDDMQPYHKRAEPDAEFPEADWGDCAVCRNEVLVAAPELLILVGPE